ncbi:MAG TPA: PIN domain-containing protein [Candidatus Kapabacteria bacterium]|nr:PIN domain-containing protein [Candidatus Kapabacteria bacterium]
MRYIFADTGYWLALLLPRDALHVRAKAVGQDFLHDAIIVTSELVIVEVLNYLHDHTIELRRKAFDIFASFRSTSLVEIVPTSPLLLDEAGRLYVRSADKEWSFTDCVSFAIMTDRNIRDALARDHHFEQAGFRALL